MENISIASSHKIVLGVSRYPKNSIIHSKSFVALPNLLKKSGKFGRTVDRTSSLTVLSLCHASKPDNTSEPLIIKRDLFASIASSGEVSTSVGVNPQLSVPPPSSHIGSPLFWIGVGVGLSALFSWVAGRVKNYAMQQVFKTFTQQMNAQNSSFSNATFPPGPPFPFPAATYPVSDSSKSSIPVTPQPVTVEVPSTKVESLPSLSVEEKKEAENVPKKYAFVDVSPDEVVKKNDFESYKESIQADIQAGSSLPVNQNGAASKQGIGASEGKTSSAKVPVQLSVEALEKMMEDPTVQNMVYPYLPEEMRNPSTFKWMLQNPQYRQQLQDMLNNMAGSREWDNRMVETLKNFDLSSPEIRQQFDQIGLTPEEVISKIMANPDVAMAFQNPRIQAAIMDCSQNPMSITKYQNDKEVMDVFTKISELFPGAGGY